MVTDQRVAGPARDDEPAGGGPLPGRYLVFMIASLALLMSSVDQTIVATALPSLQRDLHAQVNWSTWTITIYALGQVLVMPLAGKFGDQYGRKRVFLGAAVLFTAASLCCGFAGNIYLLIALRGLQFRKLGFRIRVSAELGIDHRKALSTIDLVLLGLA